MSMQRVFPGSASITFYVIIDALCGYSVTTLGHSLFLGGIIQRREDIDLFSRY